MSQLVDVILSFGLVPGYYMWGQRIHKWNIVIRRRRRRFPEPKVLLLAYSPLIFTSTIYIWLCMAGVIRSQVVVNTITYGLMAIGSAMKEESGFGSRLVSLNLSGTVPEEEVLAEDQRARQTILYTP